MLSLIYYVLLVCIVLYVSHRWQIIFLYRIHYKRKGLGLQRSKVDIHKIKANDLPYVTVQIPLYNELYTAQRIIKAAGKLDYPPSRLEIQVLDDSTDETSQLAQEACQKLNDEGVNVRYLYRENREGFKAGALKEGLVQARGEITAIFDADFMPDPDFLLNTVSYFQDPKVGAVQTRWTYLNSKTSVLTKSQKILLDSHFQLEHTARTYSGRFMNFNGSAGLLRKSAIQEAGGWESDCLTEDTDLSYRMQLKGYKIMHLPFVECMSELPETLDGLKQQQYRWTKGLVQIIRKLGNTLFKAKIPLKIKLEALLHLCSPFNYLITLLFCTLLPLVIFFSDIRQKTIILPELIISIYIILSLGFYYAYAEKEVHGSWKKSLLYLSNCLSLGVVMSFNNSLAVMGGLFGKKNDFIRTPKYGYTDKKRDDSTEKVKKYKITKNYALLIIESLYTISLNASFCLTVFNGEWFRLPLLLIFVIGLNYNLYLNLSNR